MSKSIKILYHFLMEVIPALLETNLDGLISQIKKLSSYFKTFQIDIADGIFVPNRTIQIQELLSSMEQLNNLKMNDLNFDFHLMVKDYVKEIKKLEDLKNLITIKNLFIHTKLFLNRKLSSSAPATTAATAVASAATAAAAVAAAAAATAAAGYISADGF